MNDTTTSPAGDLETPGFDSLGLSQPVQRAIDEMGFVDPTPVQLAAFAPARAGEDLIVQARTGTGKTAAFGLPLVDGLIDPKGGPQALILAPTRELALQSSREIGRLGIHTGIRTAAVYGGAPMDRQVRELEAGAQIVSGTPGRVLDHLKRGTLDGDKLKVLVLDEADEMLSMGFAKELHAIVALLPAKRQTMLFSATIDDAVERMSKRMMREPQRISLSSDAVGAKTVTHQYYLVTGAGRGRQLIRILENEDPESAIIFCNTRAATQQLASELKAAGFNAEWLNGDLPQSERERVLAMTRKGELRYLVATDVAARGIDISHVTHVINFEFPDNIESYIHRTGRTGRAGRTGTAISLVSAQALGSLYYLRLTYKIFPIERTLPTEGELQTRLETDRIELLSEAFPTEPNVLDRAVARRLLTHPEAERLLGGLLASFFGTQTEVDEGAAAARRERRPEPLPDPEPEPEAKPAPKPLAEAKPAPRPEPKPEPKREPEPKPAPVIAARDDDEYDDEGEDDDFEDDDLPSEDDRELDLDLDDGGDEHEGDDDVYLYVNLGRRDGVRPGQIIRLLATECDIDKGDVGRIRIRDRHSFVGVPRERVAEIVEQLAGKESHDKELVVELARAQR
ncbi:MAG: DEAD/DEAH box helicase [Sandaracinaceae bacterium]|nr:DEAD/DEAH box helicase [Sandaracinaceae bacterium]